MTLFNLVSIANVLGNFMQSCMPDSSKVSKYGDTLFTLKPQEQEGQFCGVFIYSAHVQLSFSNGTQLKDERKLLKGSGKFRRNINFKDKDQIDYAFNMSGCNVLRSVAPNKMLNSPPSFTGTQTRCCSAIFIPHSCPLHTIQKMNFVTDLAQI